MLPMLRKELRDVCRWIPLAMIVIGTLCWQAVPQDIHDCTGFRHRLAQNVMVGSGVLAFALGVLQSVFDSRPEARAFLLHRPLSVGQIFRCKLVTGFVSHTLS